MFTLSPCSTSKICAAETNVATSDPFATNVISGFSTSFTKYPPFSAANAS